MSSELHSGGQLLEQLEQGSEGQKTRINAITMTKPIIESLNLFLSVIVK